MSYAVSNKKPVRASSNNPTGQGYNRISNSDIESDNNDLENIKKQIESNLS